VTAVDVVVAAVRSDDLLQSVKANSLQATSSKVWLFTVFVSQETRNHSKVKSRIDGKQAFWGREL